MPNQACPVPDTGFGMTKYMSNCLFCKIIAGEIPCYKVYEDDYALAFLDIHPCSQGHTVVIPKKHITNIEKAELADWQNLSEALKKTADKVQSVVKPDGMNVGLNNNPVAGQAVPHLHWHIIPRYEGDGGGSMHSIVRNAGDLKVEDVAELFR